jgi:hypothetical protein
MNSNNFFGGLIVGTMVIGGFVSGLEPARNCAATCAGLPVAILPAEGHIPESNNNKSPSEYVVMMHNANNYNVLVQGNRT